MNDALSKGCGPHCGHWKDVRELERLRNLIVEFANAQDTYEAAVSEGVFLKDVALSVGRAEIALRKAVGK